MTGIGEMGDEGRKVGREGEWESRAVHGGKGRVFIEWFGWMRSRCRTVRQPLRMAALPVWSSKSK